MLRLLLRILLSLFLLAVGRRLGGGSRRNVPPGPGDGDGRVGGTSPRGRKRGTGPMPLDRSDVVDVPFTEIPPPADQPSPGGAPGGV
jgi:hypothetical protein